MKKNKSGIITKNAMEEQIPVCQDSQSRGKCKSSWLHSFHQNLWQFATEENCQILGKREGAGSYKFLYLR